MKKLREKFLEVSTSNEGSPPWVRLALPARQGDALPITGLDHVRPPVTFACRDPRTLSIPVSQRISLHRLG